MGNKFYVKHSEKKLSCYSRNITTADNSKNITTADNIYNYGKSVLKKKNMQNRSNKIINLPFKKGWRVISNNETKNW